MIDCPDKRLQVFVVHFVITGSKLLRILIINFIQWICFIY